MFVVVKLPRKTHSKDVVKLRTGGKDLAVHADSLCGQQLKKFGEEREKWSGPRGVLCFETVILFPSQGLQMSLNVFW